MGSSNLKKYDLPSVEGSILDVLILIDHFGVLKLVYNVSELGPWFHFSCMRC